MGEAKSNQSLLYGQSVIEPDFRTVEYVPSPRFDPDAPCESMCVGGWLSPDGEVISVWDGDGGIDQEWQNRYDYSIPCPCNPDVRGLAV